MRRLHTSIAAISAAITVVSCSDKIVQPDSTPRLTTNAAAVALITYDDKLLDISTREPTFAGLTVSDGTPVILVTDISKASTAKAAALAVLNDPRLASAIVATVRYTFKQLADWKAAASVAKLLGVVSFDIDEAQNAIRIAATTSDVAERVRSLLADQSIPSDAYTVEVRQAATPLCSTLQTRCRGTHGGFQIYWSSTQWCTLGFNATYYPGGIETSIYATNGHCTTSQGSVDSTTHYQNRYNVADDFIGKEAWTSVFVSGDPRCDQSSSCKYSDISLGRYDPNTSVLGYWIAKPTQRCRTPCTINYGLTAILRVDGEQLWPLQNDTVDKVGARTGWTYGPVTQTCVDEVVSGVEFICQYWVDAGVGRGDSGSAVFVFTSPESAIITGQLFAGIVDNTELGQTYLFSSWNNIQSEMGNLRVSTAVP
ncbi:MAG: hypothetical protein ACT4O1_13535 [Gemmatimonadota bacterium]